MFHCFGRSGDTAAAREDARQNHHQAGRVAALNDQRHLLILVFIAGFLRLETMKNVRRIAKGFLSTSKTECRR